MSDLFRHLVPTHLKIADKLVEVLVRRFALDLAGEGVDEIVLRLQVRRRLDAFADLQVGFTVQIRSLHETHRLGFAANGNDEILSILLR